MGHICDDLWYDCAVYHFLLFDLLLLRRSDRVPNLGAVAGLASLSIHGCVDGFVGIWSGVGLVSLLLGHAFGTNYHWNCYIYFPVPAV